MTITSVAAAIAAVGVAVLAAWPAAAADPAPSKKRSEPPPAYDSRWSTSTGGWTGLYFGATLGRASGTDQSGGVGTLLAGYNWRAGSTVYGLEADIGTGSFGSTRGSSDTDLNAFGSVRGRLGTLIAARTLLYATGGLAWADYTISSSRGGTTSDMLVGYQLGAGLEYAMAPQWRLRAEYVFTGFGSDSIGQDVQTSNFDPDFHTIRVGAVMKF